MRRLFWIDSGSVSLMPLPSPQHRGSLLHRAQNPRMRAAATEMLVQCRGDVGARRRRVAVEQRLGADHDPRQTVAALARLLVEERLLQRMRLRGAAQPLDRR